MCRSVPQRPTAPTRSRASSSAGSGSAASCSSIRHRSTVTAARIVVPGSGGGQVHEHELSVDLAGQVGTLNRGVRALVGETSGGGATGHPAEGEPSGDPDPNEVGHGVEAAHAVTGRV